MQQHKDPEIKLFGRNIPLQADGDAGVIAGDRKVTGGGGVEEEDETRKTEQVTEEIVPTLDAEDDHEPNKNPETPMIDEKEAKPKLGKGGKEQKPDKILPCPRCSSMDTKFCYYNNYNINQPRHFCRACQRYWTSGGMMRNVPVGAGRRKNKNSSLQHLIISEIVQEEAHLKSNGRVLSFAFDSPVCKLHSTLDALRDKLQERVVSVTSRGNENVDDCSNGSSITFSNSMDEGDTRNVTEPGMRKIDDFSSQIPCLPAVPWHYSWQFYPTPLWNCSFSGAWNVPLLCPKSSPDHTSPVSDSSPAKLGKHLREENDQEHLHTEKSMKQVRNGCVLVPKTLRICDPNEAAKSSIWAALGIKNESLGFGGILKSKGMNCLSENNLIMQANPAALYRSQNFQESS